MNSVKHKFTKKNRTAGVRERFVWPGIFLLLSFLLMLLPLEGFVSSVKAVLSYVFIPQIRAAHETVKYGEDVNQTIRELFRVHQENKALKQEMEMARLLTAQAENVLAENERLNGLLTLRAQTRWKGVWARVAYREPAQWNAVIIDKGSKDGIRERSAVLAMQNGQEGLAGVVVEVTENTAKVLLVPDEDFSAAVQLARGGEAGLLQGSGSGAVRVKYVGLLTQVEPGDRVYTASSSSIFPAGILVGTVRGVRKEESFQTALTVEVEPQVRAAALKEVFVLLAPKGE